MKCHVAKIRKAERQNGGTAEGINGGTAEWQNGGKAEKFLGLDQSDTSTQLVSLFHRSAFLPFRHSAVYRPILSLVRLLPDHESSDCPCSRR
jgi:hypothetical protein